MHSRIYGAEHEFAIRAYVGRFQMAVDEAAVHLFEALGSTEVFLANGSRLYLDYGHHPEYSTPECKDLRDLVTSEKAGERVLEGLSVEMEHRLSEDRPCHVFLFKNNTDSAGHTYGGHENYLVARSLESTVLTTELVPFLVARQLMVGAGKVLKTPAGTTYSVSQRADHMFEVSGINTTHDRSLMTSRVAYADENEYRRLHLIVGDSNMSETTNLLKFGSTSLVLDMLEGGVSFAHLRLANPIAALQTISGDLTGRAKVALLNGEERTGLEILHEYLEAARDFTGVLDASRDASLPRVFDLWDKCIDALERKQPALLGRDIDWAIKLGLITRYAESHDLPWEHPRLAQLDLAYHDIRRSRGLYYLLQHRGAVSRVTTDLETFGAKTGPPKNTRAAIRGEFVKSAQRSGATFTVDWDRLRLGSGDNVREEYLHNPFGSTNPRIERLIRDAGAWRSTSPAR